MNIFFLEQLEKDLQDGCEFFPVDRLVSVFVQEVEDIFDVFRRRAVASNQVDDGVQHLGKLFFGEPLILI